MRIGRACIGAFVAERARDELIEVVAALVGFEPRDQAFDFAIGHHGADGSRGSEQQAICL